MKKFYSALFVISIVLSSCLRDEYDLDDISATISPEIAVSFLKASIVAEDILSAVDSNMLREDENKLLEFVYSDTLYSFTLSELIDIPDKNINYDFKLDPLYIDDVDGKVTAMTLDDMVDRVGLPYSAIFNAVDGSCDNTFPPFSHQDAGEIDLEITDAPFSKATFSDGVLKVNIENKWPTELTNIELELIRVSDNMPVDTLRYASIPAYTSLADSIIMEGKTIESEMVANFITISSPGTVSDVCINGEDSLIVTMSGYDFVVVSGTAVFPNQDVLNDVIDIKIELDNGEEFETLKLKSGGLAINLNYEIKEAAMLYIELPYAVKGNSSFIDSILVSAGPSTVNESFDLSGYEFDLTKGGSEFNTVQAVIKAAVVSSGLEVDFDTSNVVSANITMENLVPEFIDGYFGTPIITMDDETQEFDLEASDLFSNMSFVNPTVSLQFHNTFGIPIEISSLNLKMQKGDESETLNSTSVIPFEIAGADVSNQSLAVTSELLLNENTNIADLINLWPNEVTTGLSGQVNPNGNSHNFASENSKLDVTLGLTVPVYGQISELTIKQYIAIDSSMSEMFKNVVKASLRSNVDNGFPLEAEINFYLADSDTLILDSLIASDGNQVLVNAGTVNGSGNVVTRGSRQADLIVDEADIALLQEGAAFIIIDAVMNTANSGADVKIYSDYDMLIKIGLLANLKIELNSDKED
jgi:hypothetical protein|tara:strand:- start:13604 stop:15700 length:2097 start_codon:yes stop_codon:yes gene_type:complete